MYQLIYYICNKEHLLKHFTDRDTGTSMFGNQWLNRVAGRKYTHALEEMGVRNEKEGESQ
jgi:hypothetical protein